MKRRASHQPWRSRSSTPTVDRLELRTLCTTAPLLAQPTFVLGPLPTAGGSLAGGYTPAQIKVAYGFNNIAFGNVAGDGSGETIAIVDAYGDPSIQF